MIVPFQTPVAIVPTSVMANPLILDCVSSPVLVPLRLLPVTVPVIATLPLALMVPVTSMPVEVVDSLGELLWYKLTSAPFTAEIN